MGRYNLKHIDRGIIYLPINNNATDEEIDNIVNNHKTLGKTIVLFRSGKSDMKRILKELLKARLTT